MNVKYRRKEEKLFNILKERAKHEYIPPIFFFIIHKVRGDMDQAFKWLERACEDRDIYLPFYVIHSDDKLEMVWMSRPKWLYDEKSRQK